MSKYILTYFNENHPLKITKNTIKQLKVFCTTFETKNNHALALNTSLLGVFPIFFLNPDQQALFDILGLDMSEVKKTISDIPTIDPSHKVSSDAYNLTTIWAAHCLMNTTTGLSQADIKEGLFNLFKMLHYKFYTSLMARDFPFRADKGIMEATIAGLSNKFDIVRYGTWKKVIEERSKDIYSTSSIHYNVLKSFGDDKKVIYVLSDTQTRIRHKVKLVVSEYYKTKERNESIGSYGLVTDDLEGEKLISHTSNVFDVMISNLSNQILNIYTFIDNQLIKAICDMFKNLRPDMFRSILNKFSETAVLQSKIGKLNETKKKKGEVYYTGARLLISELIQKTYRQCMLTKTDMKSKTQILIKTKNLYSSSRINDPDILLIKKSVQEFILSCGESRREATIASLTIGFILYIMVKSFEFL